MTKKLDLTGQNFGRLKVISEDDPYVQPNGRIRFMWKVLCECGNEFSARGESLRIGETKSCGCFRVDVVSARRMRHGQTGSKEYRIWNNMKNRCLNPRIRSYQNYGARGITVCERWLESFENFYNDMGPCPDGMSLEREKNDQGYSPANCVWATKLEQSRNRRSNVYLEFQGQSKTVKEWAQVCGIVYCTLRRRLQAGWTVEKALTK
jgi:hypothetical protein